MKRILLLVIAFFMSVQAHVYKVPHEHFTIMDAVLSANIGDTILIAPGDYFEQVNLTGKSVLIMSEEDTTGWYGTSIRYQLGNPVVIMGAGGIAGIKTEIRGINIYSGSAGITINGSADCPEYLISECRIGWCSTGIESIGESSLMIEKTEIYKNDIGITHTSAIGKAEIVNCTFHYNLMSDVSYDAEKPETASLKIMNSHLSHSVSTLSDTIDVLYSNLPAMLTPEPGIIFGAGVIHADAMFTNPELYDFTLIPTSPLVDAGAPEMSDPDASRSDIGAQYLEHTVVTLSSDELIPGRSTMIPVQVSFPDSITANSAALTLVISDPRLVFNTADMAGTLMEGAMWTLEYNQTDSLIRIWAAGAQHISGTGTLINLLFEVPLDVEGGPVSLHISDCSFDESNYPLVITNKSISIFDIIYGDVSLNGTVSPYDASMILKYIVGSAELDEYQATNGDVTANGLVTAMDASMILQYGVGIIEELPVDTVDIMTGGLAKFLLEGNTYVPGDIVRIPLQVTDASNLLSFEGEFRYDPAVFSSAGIEWTETFSSYYRETMFEEGTVRIAVAGSLPDDSDRTVAVLNFVAAADANTATSISLDRLRVNENNIEYDLASVTLSPKLVSIEQSSTIPDNFILEQNYPNPFNPDTRLRYGLPEASDVRLAIYDLYGSPVKSWEFQAQSAGWHEMTWNGTDMNGRILPTGIYMLRITSNEFTAVRKMLLLK